MTGLFREYILDFIICLIIIDEQIMRMEIEKGGAGRKLKKV